MKEELMEAFFSTLVGILAVIAVCVTYLLLMDLLINCTVWVKTKITHQRLINSKLKNNEPKDYRT